MAAKRPLSIGRVITMIVTSWSVMISAQPPLNRAPFTCWPYAHKCKCSLGPQGDYFFLTFLANATAKNINRVFIPSICFYGRWKKKDQTLHVDKSRIFHPQKITVEKMFFSSRLTWGDYFFGMHWLQKMKMVIYDWRGFCFTTLATVWFSWSCCVFRLTFSSPMFFWREKNPWRILNYR